MKRRGPTVVVVVIDGFGVGPAPDYFRYHSHPTHTAQTVVSAAQRCGYTLSNMWQLGLGAYLGENPGVGNSWTLVPSAAGCDTPSGHWELMGCTTTQAPPTWPDGFDSDLAQGLADACGVEGWLGNVAINGVVALDRWGQQHCDTDLPILYTSADSVLQVACHEDTFGLARLNDICATARTYLDNWADERNEAAVTRVISRPFAGTGGNWARTNNRRDWSMSAPSRTALDAVADAGLPVTSIGKIGDIFAHRSTGTETHPAGDAACFAETIRAVEHSNGGLVFTSLVEFDSRYGHPRDPDGYASHLAWFDSVLGDLTKVMRPGDRLVLTADHGNDPTAAGNDHTREVVPGLVWGPDLDGGYVGVAPMSSLGQAICCHLGVTEPVVPASIHLEAA